MSKFHLMKKDDEGEEWVELFKKSDYPDKDILGKPVFQIGYDSQSKAKTNAEVLSKSRKTEIAIMYHRTGHHEIIAVFNHGKLVGEETIIKTRERKRTEGV